MRKKFERLLAVSRTDKKTMICDECGLSEALCKYKDSEEKYTLDQIVDAMAQAGGVIIKQSTS